MAENQEKKKRGAKPLYTPAELAEKVDEFLTMCEENEKPPLFPDLLLYLKISRTTYNRYMGRSSDSPANWEEYAEPLERAQLVRESYLLKRMVSDNKLAQGCLNALKQPENGGYTDRPVDSGEMKLTINLLGVGGEAAAK